MKNFSHFIILISLFLFSSVTISSMENKTGDDDPFRHIPHPSSFVRQIPGIICPIPIRPASILNQRINIENLAKRQDNCGHVVFAKVEQDFRFNAHQCMANHEQLMSVDLFPVKTFLFTGQRLCFDNGFYEKMEFLDENNQRLLSQHFSSLLLPIWSTQPKYVRDFQGIYQLTYQQNFVGYAYKKWEDCFWLWIDMTPQPQ